MNSRKSDPKFVRAYDRGMLRSAFVSLFWAVITERKKKGFTFQALAKLLGTNKGEVSRWFNGDPNWTINTIANLASALDVDIKIEAIDRASGAIFTPAGLVRTSSQTSAKSSQATLINIIRTAGEPSIKLPFTLTRVPHGIAPDGINASFSDMAA
jgi:transcriptional regulator with XRE-family HTH domain